MLQPPPPSWPVTPGRPVNAVSRQRSWVPLCTGAAARASPAGAHVSPRPQFTTRESVDYVVEENSGSLWSSNDFRSWGGMRTHLFSPPSRRPTGSKDAEKNRLPPKDHLTHWTQLSASLDLIYSERVSEAEIIFLTLQVEGRGTGTVTARDPQLVTAGIGTWAIPNSQPLKVKKHLIQLVLS